MGVRPDARIAVAHVAVANPAVPRPRNSWAVSTPDSATNSFAPVKAADGLCGGRLVYRYFFAVDFRAANPMARFLRRLVV